VLPRAYACGADMTAPRIAEVRVGSSNTRPSARTGTSADPGWEDERDLRYPRGYVVNRWTGEVLSSVIADVRREQRP
jgi:hypothetical protein